MHRIIEVCLLVLLCRPEGENAHGYALGERLTEFGFDESEISVSTLYRTLRGMEEAGWVTSGWAAGGQGPQRRQYTITDAGRQALDRWAAVLMRRQQRIGLVLDAYEQLGRTPVEDAAPPDDMPEAQKQTAKSARPARKQTGKTRAREYPDEAPADKPAPVPQITESFADYWV